MSQPKHKLPPRDEIERFAADMAQEAHLLDNPLPRDIDFDEEKMRAIQQRLFAMQPPLPPSFTDPLFIAFSSRYLPALATALRTLSLDTQRKAFSALVQILSLLPVLRDPYFRRFFGSPQAAGLPTLLARAFVQGIDWLRPSGPGPLCDLFFHMLIWGDPATGDDAQTCFDKRVRAGLAAKVASLEQSPSIARLDATQQAQIARLHKALSTLEHLTAQGVSARTWVEAQRGLQENDIPGLQDCAACFDDDKELFLCSKCKTVKYCSQECQLKDWKAGHKIRCYETTY